MFFAAIAILAAGLFSGAALYINLVEHPARMKCGVDLAVKEFAPSYRRAAVMQASLAAVGLVAGIAAWVAVGHIAPLIGGALLGSAIPFTLLVIHPTNKRLLDPAVTANSIAAERLLARWQTLHAVRTILGLAAFCLLVWWIAAQ